MKCKRPFTWTGFDGISSTVSVEWKDSMEEAFNATLEFARELGWTPPRWWQWWRWRDQPRSEVFSKD